MPPFRWHPLFFCLESPPVTKAQRIQIQKLLIALERELSGKGPASIEPNRASDGEVGTAEDEQPLNEMLQAIASHRNKNQSGVLLRVQRALAKLKFAPGEFGQCEECGENIAIARIKALPFAEYCVQCQGRRDAPKGGPTRRKLNEYT
jgi:DnaK suppressor protein